MLAEDVRRTIRRLWDLFWSGGIANPLSAIEQISYLIFLKRLEDLDKEEAKSAAKSGVRFDSRFKGHEECRWSSLGALPANDMFALVTNKAFPFLKSLGTSGGAFAAAMKDAIFIIPKPTLLAEAVQLIDSLPIGVGHGSDIQGDLYEDLLKELNLSGKNGQFRTARHVVQIVTELANPQLGEWVCDPAAGTAGFLVAAHQWILGKSAKKRGLLDGQRFVGFDFDTTMVRLGLMNMLLHGIRHPEMRYQDTLSSSFQPPRRFDVVLANPPFAGTLHKGEINSGLLTLQTNKTELLFVELCLALLEDEGRCAIIVPEGVLYNSSNAHKELRKRLMDENQVDAVVSLPSGSFRPYTGVKTSIVLVTKGGRTDDVWFYEVTGDGYTLDDKRQPDPRHDDMCHVPAAFRILRRGSKEPWASREAEEIARSRQWTATRGAILDRGYNLSPSAYRPTEGAAKGPADPDEVLGRMLLMETQIREKLERLRTLIHGSLQ